MSENRPAVALAGLAAIAWGGVSHATTKECWNTAVRNQYQEALQFCRPVAEEGDPFAQYVLGTMHAHGEAVPQDYVEAIKWYGRAAEQGYAEAQYALGLLRYKGKARR